MKDGGLYNGGLYIYTIDGLPRFRLVFRGRESDKEMTYRGVCFIEDTVMADATESTPVVIVHQILLAKDTQFKEGDVLQSINAMPITAIDQMEDLLREQRPHQWRVTREGKTVVFRE